MAWLGVGDALNVVLFFAAYQATSVAIAVLTHYLTPIFVALAAPLVLRERMSARTCGAVAASFAGLVLMLAPVERRARRGALVGAPCGAGSAVFYASNVVVNKRLVAAFSASEMMFSTASSRPRSWPRSSRSARGRRAAAPSRSWSLGGLGPGALAGLLFMWGLRRMPASHASTLTLLEPLVAVVLAALVSASTSAARRSRGGADFGGGGGGGVK